MIQCSDDEPRDTTDATLLDNAVGDADDGDGLDFPNPEDTDATEDHPITQDPDLIEEEVVEDVLGKWR